MNNLVNQTDRASVTRGSTSGAGAGLWNFDPFRNFFSNAPAMAGLDISRTEKGYVVEIPVAGFRPEQVDITLENGILCVSGKTEKRSFTRSFLLPDEVDADNIDAKVEHGLLTLTLNLLPKAQPKKISIKAS